MFFFTITTKEGAFTEKTEWRKKDISEIVGGGYSDFWRFKGRYRVVKGGRGAKKSATAALWYIYHLMKYPLANLLVVRRYANSHRDSTYAQLQWAVRALGVEHLWRWTKTPLEMTFVPTGQRIIFRGMDDPESIHSVTVNKGSLCWVWLEEAFQIERERDFDKLDMSVRGNLPKGYFKQLTLTFNPWSAKHWLKQRFFDEKDPEVLAMTTTYQDNEFLDEGDRAVFAEMSKKFRRYDVEGLGNWGVTQGLVYEDWVVMDFDHRRLLRERPTMRPLFGLDFGFTHDPSAFIGLLLDEEAGEIYIFAEDYRRGMLNSDIAAMIKAKGFGKERIVADSAEPKSIAELRRLGLSRIVGAKKGPDSLRYGIQRLRNYRIRVHSDCRHTQEELSAYAWDESGSVPLDRDNHLMDALRYAMEGAETGIAVFK
ncbi:MAG: PBSX family phage terminase large subunit [Bacillota bacterium]|nr:PBSX family phage terminase large subunit [Bacillota bacterium]